MDKYEITDDSKGGSYRIYSTVKAYKGADSESIAIFSNIVNY